MDDLSVRLNKVENSVHNSVGVEIQKTEWFILDKISAQVNNRFRSQMDAMFWPQSDLRSGIVKETLLEIVFINV